MFNFFETKNIASILFELEDEKFSSIHSDYNRGVAFEKFSLDKILNNFNYAKEWFFLQEEYWGFNLENINPLLSNIFYSGYEIPYKFKIGVKPVKSGYSESSSGNGCNSSTVYHIVLDEDISIGRLKRLKDDFLCSQPTWDSYSDIEHLSVDLPVITCLSCLNKIKKYKV